MKVHVVRKTVWLENKEVPESPKWFCGNSLPLLTEVQYV
jgi:hypothetical protein